MFVVSRVLIGHALPIQSNDVRRYVGAWFNIVVSSGAFITFFRVSSVDTLPVRWTMWPIVYSKPMIVSVDAHFAFRLLRVVRVQVSSKR